MELRLETKGFVAHFNDSSGTWFFPLREPDGVVCSIVQPALCPFRHKLAIYLDLYRLGVSGPAQKELAIPAESYGTDAVESVVPCQLRLVTWLAFKAG